MTRVKPQNAFFALKHDRTALSVFIRSSRRQIPHARWQSETNMILRSDKTNLSRHAWRDTCFAGPSSQKRVSRSEDHCPARPRRPSGSRDALFGSRGNDSHWDFSPDFPRPRNSSIWQFPVERASLFIMLPDLLARDTRRVPRGRKGQRKIGRVCIQPYAYVYARTRAPACSNEKENYFKITCCSLR